MAVKNNKQAAALGEAEVADLVEQLRERLKPYLAAIDSRLVEALQQCTPQYIYMNCPREFADKARKSPQNAMMAVFFSAMIMTMMNDPAYSGIETRLSGFDLPDEWVTVKEWVEERKLMEV